MDSYFAKLPAEELQGALQDKVREWSAALNKTGLQRKWWKSYRTYYNRNFSKNMGPLDTEISRLGDKGELAAFQVNHYASILKHIHVMATNQNPSFDARAINSDAASLQQAKMANNILDAYMRDKRLGRYLSVAAEHALIFGKGFVFANWEPSLGNAVGATFQKDEQGQPIMGEDGQPKEKVVYEGDLDLSNPSVFDVYVDQSCEDWSKLQWVNVRVFKNKWDLAEIYPHAADELAGLDTKNQLDGLKYFTFQQFDLSSDIPVYYFFHKRSKAIPNGRLVIYTLDGPVLYDGPIPYDDLPVFRIVPGEIFGSTEGYTVGFDLLAIQEAYDVIVSALFTNQQANAVQKYWVPEGANITATQLSKGLAILRGPQGAEPKPLQMTASPQESYQFLPMLEGMMEKLSGVNSVIRGDPEHSLKSGVALGLVQSMATQYMSGYQQAWARLLEDVGTFIIYLLKSFANTERMVAMAGKHFQSYMQTFKGADLDKVKRVVVDLGNPMARTLAGRFDMAKMLQDMGQIKTPQDLISVLETGQLDRVTEGPLKRADLVQSENERLNDGKPIQALVGDGHLYHIQEHLTVSADPETRSKADQGDKVAMQILQNVQNHIIQHLQLYQTQDPVWAAVSGEPPAPQPMMPPGGPPQGPPGGPPPGPPPSGPHGGPMQGPPMQPQLGNPPAA